METPLRTCGWQGQSASSWGHLVATWTVRGEECAGSVSDVCHKPGTRCGLDRDTPWPPTPVFHRRGNGPHSSSPLALSRTEVLTLHRVCADTRCFLTPGGQVSQRHAALKCQVAQIFMADKAACWVSILTSLRLVGATYRLHRCHLSADLLRVRKGNFSWRQHVVCWVRESPPGKCMSQAEEGVYTEDHVFGSF